MQINLLERSGVKHGTGRHAYWHKQYFLFGQRDWICRVVMLLTELCRKEHNVPKIRTRSTHILQNENDLFIKLLHPLLGIISMNMMEHGCCVPI